MNGTKIESHKITRPIQLLAVWMAALVLLVGEFMSGAALTKEPVWLPAILFIGAFVIVITFIVLMFLMQTKYRAQLQEDFYYSDFLIRQEKNFKHFKPENIAGVPVDQPVSVKKYESWQEREQRRIQIYEGNMGLFLVHAWRPSHTPGQVADIAISLAQHGKGPLSQGKVKSVEYHLGPMFFKEPVVKTKAKENFRLDVSAYGPMLCIARVHFKDRTPYLDLERYINF